MTTINTASKTSIVRSLRERLAGKSTMDGQAGSLVRKLIDGKRLSQLEQDIAAATGLVGAVADLYGATGRAQSGATGLVGAKNTADVFLKTRNVMNKAAEADRLYAQRYAGYGKFSQKVHGSAVAQGLNKTQSQRDFIVRTAGDVVTVAGLGLSAAALPGLTKKVATSFQELGTLVHDANATTDQRLDKLEELTRASAGTVFSAQGVVVGAKGVANIVSRNATIGRGLATVGSSPITKFITSPIGKVFNVLLPVADGAVLIGEAIATRRTFNDPTATGEQKLRKALDLSLAGLKAAFWIFPQVRFLRSIYGVAGLGQLGLTLWDLRKEMGPKLVQAAKTAAWGVTHPVQAAKAIGSWFNNTVGTAARWTWDKVSHPGRTASEFGTEVKAWYNTLFNKSRSAVSAWFPGANTQQPVVAQAPVMTPVTTPAAPVAPVAPVAAPVAPAAPVAAVPTTPAVATALTTDAAFQAAMAEIGAVA